MPLKAKVVWSVYAKSGRLRKDGTIDGVPMRKVWKKCQSEASRYLREKLKDPRWGKLLKEECEQKDKKLHKIRKKAGKKR